MRMNEEIKPCPYCKSNDAYVASTYPFGMSVLQCICPDCGTCGPSVSSGVGWGDFNAKEQAVALWNDMPRGTAVEWNDLSREITDKQPAKPDEVTAPAHYAGDGVITCKDAMSSMAAGYDKGGVTTAQAYWSISALKYLWRWPLKGSPLKDLKKARECVELAIKATESKEEQ